MSTNMPINDSAQSHAEGWSDVRSDDPQAGGVAEGTARKVTEQTPPDCSGESAASTETGSMSKALSVTRLAHFSKSKPAPSHIQLLGCGIDSLDLGLFVSWGDDWEQFGEFLEERKQAAAGTKGIALGADDDYLMLPSGKPPQYRWHLKHPDFDLFLGRSRLPFGRTPNVYVSLSSRLLWMRGPVFAAESLHQHIAELGGTIVAMKPSRCDLAADFHVPGGIQFDFLRAHRVPVNRQTSVNMLADDLETYYFGAKKSPIQLRIYDKGKEILASGKDWFLDVWDQESGDDVWRVEFQLRREVLKQYRIETVDDLVAKLCSIWEYLTIDWFSLRLHDNENTSRRSFHPWWASVSGIGEKFGKRFPAKRLRRTSDAKSHWLVTHIAGCFKSLAACRDKPTLTAALDDLNQLLKAKCNPDTFAEDVRVRQIRRGIPVSPEKDFKDE